MTRIVKRIATASIELITGSFEVTGAVTASRFLGDDEGGISFIGSSSFALNTDSASAALNSLSASVAAVAVEAFASPFIIPMPTFLDQVKLINVQPEIVEVEHSLVLFNLAAHPFSRIATTIIEGVDSASLGRPRIGMQYSLSPTGPWSFLDGAEGPYVDITGSTAGTIRTAGPTITHASESLTNVFLRAVTYSGSVTPPFPSPTIFAAFVFLQVQEGVV